MLYFSSMYLERMDEVSDRMLEKDALYPRSSEDFRLGW